MTDITDTELLDAIERMLLAGSTLVVTSTQFFEKDGPVIRISGINDKSGTLREMLTERLRQNAVQRLAD